MAFKLVLLSAAIPESLRVPTNLTSSANVQADSNMIKKKKRTYFHIDTSRVTKE